MSVDNTEVYGSSQNPLIEKTESKYSEIQLIHKNKVRGDSLQTNQEIQQIESCGESDKLSSLIKKQQNNEMVENSIINVKKLDFQSNLNKLSIQKWKEQSEKSLLQKQIVQQQIMIDENYKKMIKKRIESTKIVKQFKKPDFFEDNEEQDEMQLQQDDYKTPEVSASENFNRYVKNYGINFEIPSSNIQKCRFFNLDPTFSLQLVNYIIPSHQEQPKKEEHNLQTVKIPNLLLQKDNNEQEDQDENDEEDQEDLREDIMNEKPEKKNEEDDEENKFNVQQTYVKSHFLNGDSSKSLLQEQYKNLQKGVYLKLLKKEEGESIKTVEEIMLGLEDDDITCRQAEMRFSYNSKYLAIFLCSFNYLKIIKIDDGNIEQVFKNIAEKERRFIKETAGILSDQERKDKMKQIFQENQENYYWVYPNYQQKEQLIQNRDLNLDFDLSWVKTLYFDQQDKYIVLLGKQKFIVLDLENKVLESKYEIKDYQEILDIQFDSDIKWKEKENKTNYKCVVSCLQFDNKMVDIFDIDYYAKQYDKHIHKKTKHIRQIQYLKLNKTEHLYTKISLDFKKIILTLGKEENYILENEEEIFFSQKQIKEQQDYKYFTSYKTSLRKLNQLNGRQVRFVKIDQSGNFFLVAFEDYDSYIDIIYSEGPNNPIKFYRDIEPGLIQCHDLHIQQDPSDKENKCTIRLSTVKDAGDSFYLDQATFYYQKFDQLNNPYNYIKVINKNNGQKGTYEDIEYQLDIIAPSQGFSFKWPYIAMSFRPNWVIILNAFDNTCFHRVQLPDDTQIICQTFITETNDLYILANKEKYYKLFKIDLDEGNLKEKSGVIDFSFKVQNVLQYSSDLVKRKPLLDLHIRGSSDKERVNNNEKLIVCILHQDTMYTWIQGRDNKFKINSQHSLISTLREQKSQILNGDSQLSAGNKLKILQLNLQITDTYKQFQTIENLEKENIELFETQSKQFYATHDECFFLMKDEFSEKNKKEVVSQVIYKFEIDFGQTRKSEVIREFSNYEKILNFNVDVQDQKLLIFAKVQKLDDDKNSKLTIYDIRNKKIEHEQILTWKRLIGRLKSGLYKAAAGHLYFGNNVIKIRYDILKNSQHGGLTDTQAYDYFGNVFFIEKTEKIMAICPEICYTFNKFVYIIKNTEKPKFSSQKATHIYIFPFLHDQKIYLHRQKPNTEYFYTQIENKAMIELKKTKTILKNNTQSWKFKSIKTIFTSEQIEEEIKVPKKSFYRQIVCMNLTESKYYIFSKRGLLINRIDYSKEVAQYGKIIAVSPNGLNFILSHQSNDQELGQNNEITVFRLNELSFLFVKKINIEKDIKNYIQDLLLQKNQEQGQKLQYLLTEPNAPNNWVFQKNKKVFDYSINDQMDVFIIIKNRQKTKNIKNNDVEAKQNTELELKKNCCRKINKIKTTMNKVEHQMNQLKKNVFKENDVTNDNEQLRNDFLQYQYISYFQVASTGLENLPDETLKLLELMPIEKEEQLKESFILFLDKNKKNLLISSIEKKEEISYEDLKNQNLEILQDEFLEQDQDGEYIINAVPKKFTMNKNYFLMWDQERIQAFDIRKFENLPVSFSIPNTTDEVKRKIIDIRLGTKSTIMAIIISFNSESDSIVFWNLKGNCEKSTVDVSKNYELLWDPSGYPYILDGQKVYFVKQVCSMMCFEEKDMIDIRSNNKTYDYLTSSKGISFDGDNHNYMILQNYLSLGFSLMHFIIKHKTEKNRQIQVGVSFDPIPYNYLFNKSTAFLDSKFVRQDHEFLNQVCEALRKIDPGLLFQLHYTKMDKYVNYNGEISSKIEKMLIGENNEKPKGRPVKESCLHIAQDSGNNRAVDIILKYLAENQSYQVSFYEDIMSFLVGQKEFITYMGSIRYQNSIIKDKQILKLMKPYKPSIIALNDSKQTYLDSQYYRSVMHEGQDTSLLNKISNLFSSSDQNENLMNLRSFPVDIRALELSWIINEENQNGLTFLYAIREAGNIDLYNEQSIIAIIEYLYKKFLPYILWRTLPFNIVQIFIFFAMLYVNELSYEIISIDEYQDNIASDPASTQSLVNINQKYNVIQIILAAINLGLTAQFFYQVAREFYELTKGDNVIQFFTELFNWIYFIFIGLNTTLSVLIIFDLQVENQRRIAAFLVLFVFMRLLYYLKLVEGLNKHIDIFFYIIEGVTSVLALMVILIVAFSNSFYMLARNQIQFDISQNCPAEAQTPPCQPPSFPAFQDFQSSLFYTYGMLIGSLDTSAFPNGQSQILSIIFCLSTFFLSIILINMVVAVMGDIFSQSSETYDRMKLQEQLQFVLDNWRYRDRMIDMETAKFIIVAYNIDSFSQDDKNISELNSNVLSFKDMLDQFKNQMQQIQSDLLSHFEEQAKQNNNLIQQIKQKNILS